jgi:hypothetical protein
VRRFTYNKVVAGSILYGALLIVVGVALGVGIVIRASAALGILFALVWCAFFLPLAINTALLKSDIIVTEEGLSWEIYGVRWKNILWNKISRIRTVRVFDFVEKRE